jgi:hypothetical protein
MTLRGIELKPENLNQIHEMKITTTTSLIKRGNNKTKSKDTGSGCSYEIIYTTLQYVQAIHTSTIHGTYQSYKVIGFLCFFPFMNC